MRKLSSVLALALLAGVAAPLTAAAQPVVIRGGVKVTVTGPTVAPPAPRQERRPVPRRGYVWVAGAWDWSGGRWIWRAGHFERRQRGKAWNDRRWEQRDGRWERVGGDWRDAPKEPPAPPEPVAESPQFRRGHVWVKGHWEWNDGGYDWVPGKLERRQRGRRWQEGQWANVGGRWTWNAGTWSEAPREPVQPPAPLPESTQYRRGFVWVPGYWEWDNGDYEWVPGKLERRQPGKRFRRGEWTNTGGKWSFTPGGWDAPKDQDVPPPLLDEKWTERPNYVWARGYWAWEDGDYVWKPGHQERQQPGKTWVNAEWGRVDSKWVFTPGRWQ